MGRGFLAAAWSTRAHHKVCTSTSTQWPAPALALGGLGLWAVLTLLAVQATIGASSHGHRLPGDPGNRIYLTLAAGAVAATVLGVAAWGVAVVAAPGQRASGSTFTVNAG